LSTIVSFKILSKNLKPLPLPKTDEEGHVFDAFTDPEIRYRM
jgi:lysyl-tRNA synthetase class 2